ncbi:hypothetical protein CPCC7001_914 [Cyanobium sp. PCC 7001]|nr:hypothetical protein CPCC7001_914 [Cyanobium sp. PCC 7001]
MHPARAAPAAGFVTMASAASSDRGFQFGAEILNEAVCSGQ